VKRSLILIIDDEAAARDVLDAYLSGSEFDIVFAETPFDGLEKAALLGPDIVLLDVMMPGLDGYEVCRRFRADPALAEIPIIMTTSLDDRTSRLQGIQAGADEFLSKPFDSVELKIRIRALLQLNQYRRMLHEREGLQHLTTHLQAAREEERTHIAREVHDELGQLLTALRMDLEWLQSEQSVPPAQAANRLRAMIELTDQALHMVHRITSELRPGLLDDLGLAAAVEWQCDEFSNRSGIATRLLVRPEGLMTDRDRSTALFRIVQETLTNIARHAHADRVNISLIRENQSLLLCVRDNGVGATASQLGGRSAFGILGMRERVHALGGTIAIRGVAGRGTIVSLRIPEVVEPNNSGT
jgi:signal transduction histidine kinase